MTPDQEKALLAATTKGLDDDLREAFNRVVQMIRDGMPPRDAVDEAIRSFAGEFEALLTQAFSAVLAASVGSESMIAIEIGSIQLSTRLYSRSQDTAQIIQNIIKTHAQGFSDSRSLMLEIFEGYGFKDDPLKVSPNNPALPQYLRDLMTDGGLSTDMQRLFARAQVDALKSPALKASYLEALDALERGKGAAYLEKKMEVAWNEKMRYFARRISETELHKAYSKRRMYEIMGDTDVEFVEIRRSGRSSWSCICDLIAGRDKYGVGRGVYPKHLAPLPPYHPFCRCNAVPRLDIPLGKKWRDNPNADQYFLRNVGMSMSAQIMGSKSKAEAALKGEDPIKLANAGKPDGYRIKPIA